MRILFLTDNFPPEVNAPATRTYEHCREWVNRGVEVIVITCAPNFPEGKVYSGYKNKLFQREVVDGIKVIRVWSYISANEGFINRISDYLSFAIMATISALFIKTDLIIATSPQFFTAAAGRWISFLKQIPWIMEVRDLWPESIKNVEAMNSSNAIRFLEWWEYRLYKTASKIVVVTESFRKFISNRGINGNKIHIIYNGANVDLYFPREKNKELQKTHHLEGKFVVSYIGTHGLAHTLAFILDCANELKNTDFHFLFIGTGAEKAKLVTRKNDLNLKNVTFLDPIQKLDVPEYLSISDISLIPLRKSSLFHTVIPSKIFETSAMQIPILLGVEGESKAIIESFNAGLCFEPENKDDFIQKLNTLYKEKEIYMQCQQGCAKLAKAFDRKKLALYMLEIIRQPC